uniref:Uncharacterized protein n=1 Tax=Myoviridae sp. ctj3P51 TaxID=2826687 RepID=A0A8S5NNP2_9CAUD|nr:MAG TPA: hypothetical protein [Myoviridae sp. ctj3P51]
MSSGSKKIFHEQREIKCLIICFLAGALRGPFLIVNKLLNY